MGPEATNHVVICRKPRLKVSGPDGKHPFMRGMLTHSLLRKGLTFEEASSVANAVRDHLIKDGEASSQDVEIATRELPKLVLRLVRDVCGTERARELIVAPRIAGDQPAAHTAAKLRSFLTRTGPLLADHPVNQQRRAKGLLPATGLITRQAGRHRALPTLEERFGLRCRAIVGDSTVTGVMRLLGCETFTQPGFTANADTDLEGKLAAAQAGLAAGHDVVLLHVKALDILSHDRLPERSVALLERLDALMGSWMARAADGLLVAISGDHSTSSVSGDHIETPTPALIHGDDVARSGVEAFHERALSKTGAPVLRRGAFFQRVIAALGR